jgi:TPR repeat protein
MAYETGRHVPQSCRQAAEWVQKSAQDGNPAAQYNLALRYKSGDGVRASATEGEKWMQQSADHDYPSATADVVAMETAP